jgi:hypothetical protein
MEQVAFHCEGYSCSCSRTSLTALSRISGGICCSAWLHPPNIRSLNQTRGDSMSSVNRRARSDVTAICRAGGVNASRAEEYVTAAFLRGPVLPSAPQLAQTPRVVGDWFTRPHDAADKRSRRCLPIQSCSTASAPIVTTSRTRRRCAPPIGLSPSLGTAYPRGANDVHGGGPIDTAIRPPVVLEARGCGCRRTRLSVAAAGVRRTRGGRGGTPDQ